MIDSDQTYSLAKESCGSNTHKNAAYKKKIVFVFKINIKITESGMEFCFMQEADLHILETIIERAFEFDDGKQKFHSKSGTGCHRFIMSSVKSSEEQTESGEIQIQISLRASQCSQKKFLLETSYFH